MYNSSIHIYTPKDFYEMKKIYTRVSPFYINILFKEPLQ